MTMMLRRAMMVPESGGGGSDLIQVTINSEPTTAGDCLDALVNAVNLPGRSFIAFVDDYDYMVGGGSNCECVVYAGNGTTGVTVYRNDATSAYGYLRALSALTTECNIPAGTVFSVFVYPDVTGVQE